jgi:hypothetical protein
VFHDRAKPFTPNSITDVPGERILGIVPERVGPGLAKGRTRPSTDPWLRASPDGCIMSLNVGGLQLRRDKTPPIACYTGPDPQNTTGGGNSPLRRRIWGNRRRIGEGGLQNQ